MDELDSQLPLGLVLGLILSVAAHVLAVPAAHWALTGSGETMAQADDGDQKKSEPSEDNPLKARQNPRLGQRESNRQTVAWISHKAYQQMIAPQGRTEQPALQEQAEPSQGPPELDPTPPVPRPEPRETARRPAGEPPVIDSLGAARPTQGLPQTPTEAGELTFRPEPVKEPGPATQPTTANASRQGGRRGERQTRAKQPRLPSRPTAAPKSDKESPTPTQIQPPKQRIRPGGVIAAEGIEIKTKAPRFSAIAKLTVPINPRVAVTFDPSGEVIDAKFLRSTGYDNVDSPILNSLYQWKATGPRVEASDRPFTITINILLRSE